MPELAPKQLAIWLLIGALVLYFGARALNDSKAQSVGLSSAGYGGRTGATGGGQPGSGDFELVDDPAHSGKVVFVHVAGAVRRPGLYRLPEGSRQAQAIRRAGGALPRAALDAINLAAPLVDGQQLFVPKRGQDAAAVGAATSGGAPGPAAAVPGTAAGAPGAGGSPISLATATAEQLEEIDGIGPVTAAKILDFRDSQGGISSIEELDAIPGIGPATMEKLRQALVP